MNRRNIAFIVILAAVLLGTYWANRNQNSTQGQPSETNSQTLGRNGQLQVKAGSVEYASGISGHYAEPEETGNYPGVIMIHEWWGLNQHIKDTANQLAREGYKVLAVDLFKGSVATEAEQARAQVSGLNQEEALANLRAAKAYLTGQNSTKVAALGWCFGGGQAMQLSVSGEPLDGTVIYYGNLVTDRTRLANIKWPVLGIFGDQDTSIPVAQVQEFDSALDALGIRNSVNIYPNVGHAFANPSGQTYAPEATRDAWDKTLAFLDENLK